MNLRPRILQLLASCLVIQFSLHSISLPAQEQSPPTPTAAQDNDKAKNPKQNQSKAERRRRPPVASDRVVKVAYGLPAWNQNSTEIDFATIFMRDAKTQKLVQIRLEETEPDSATFEGSFAISWGSVQEIIPEIYVPESEITDQKKLVEFINQVNRKQIKRKPFILRRADNGIQIIDVYDTREQAVAALNAYRAQERLKRQAEVKPGPTPIPKESVLETEKLAQIKAAENALALEAAKREAERIRMEQLEQQRAEERRKKMEEMKQAEIEASKQKALALAEKAMAAYREGNFKSAEELFEQSVELDPKNLSYYFRYGVALYKNEKFNQSIVILKRTETQGTEALERDFYVGLNHYRLQEIEQSLAVFGKIKATNQKPIAASAAFYEGMVLFNKADYDPAKDSFQYVLDNSEDPKLDERADEYIDKIARIKNFQANKAKKILLEASMGGIYDSNVLQQSDSSSDQGRATNKASPRVLMSGSIEYRPIYEMQHETSIKTNVSNIYTTDTTLATSDHLLVGISTPYKYKGTIGEKGYQLSVEPIYEHLQIPVGTDLMDSAVVNVDNTIIMNPNWFSSYKLAVRKDNSLTTPSSTDDTTSALKISLSAEQTYFKDKERRRATLSKLGLSVNTAEGKNNTYQRLDLGIGYINPWKWDTSLISKLDLYYLTYNQRDTVRTDLNTALSFTVGKKINDWSSWGAVLGYTLNSSSDTSTSYNKLTITAVYSAKTGW